MKKHKINIVTLGCSKNVVDSEHLYTQLKASNYEVVHNSNATDAHTVIINTCGFIKDAKEESINTILQFANVKEHGKLKRLYVIGCLTERYKTELEKEIPEVDMYFGQESTKEILEALHIDYKQELIGERLISTPSHFAYLKISEGCDRTCSFCAIPLIRGKHKSVAFETLVHEAQYLAKNGAKELILIAQDLSYYGLDLYKKNRLAELLTELEKIDGIERIRLHYAYPAGFPEEVIGIMKRSEKICNYIDIPIQHISDKVLQAMRRGHTKQKTLDLIVKMRLEIPDIVIRTTLLVGHPGETEQDFEELKEFVRAMRFDRLGVFTYSPEENTHAGDNLEDTIPEEVKQQRAEEIMAIQQEISLENNRARVGKTYKVLIDRKEGDYFIGRTEYDSPEVDNEVLITSGNSQPAIGKFYNVNITKADDFDLFGEIV